MLKALFFAPILFILVLFALSNPQTVHLGLWPTDLVIDMPLSITVLIAMAVSFVIGSVMLWLSAVGARMRARRAEHAVRMLEAQLAELKARTSSPATSYGTALLPPA